jgi:hypothetical protein
MNASEDTESEIELLKELYGVNLSWEESQELTRAKGKRVLAWGKVRRTA